MVNRRVFLESATGLSAVSLAFGSTRPRILLAYASRCGSTREVAQAIAGDLERRGFPVDVRDAKTAATLAGYGAVVVGSAVRFGKWLPEASGFVERQRAGLNRLPVAFFSVHMMNTGTDEASRKAREAYTAPVRALVRPAAETFFAGRMDLARLSFGDRLIAKLKKARNEDRRDWPAIHAWASGLFAA